MDQFNRKIEELKAQYSKKNRPVLFDFRDFCSNWVWTKRSDVYTHYFHKYPAKLIPYIPIFFLSSSICKDDEIVMDPFAGSGTVLLESIVNPVHKRNCIGIEINPLARLIAKVKTTPLDEIKLNDRKKELYSNLNKATSESIIPDYENLSTWFSKNTQKKLGRLRACIEKMEDDDYKDFFLVCFSSIIRKVALADPNIPPPVVLRLRKYRSSKEKYKMLKKFLEDNQRPNVKKIFKESVQKNENRIKELNKIEEVAKSKIKARIVWDDSRDPKIGKLAIKGNIQKKGARSFRENSIGLIITSPPYITAQKYIRTTKLELLWLGLVDSDELASLDRNIIGSERVKASDEMVETGINEIDNLCNRIAKLSRDRAVMVNKYFNNMYKVLNNAYRILKKDGCMILVVGDNKVCGYDVKTHRFLAIIGESVGFKNELIIKDPIRSRGMITKRHINGGLINDEFVVVLKK